MNNQLIKKQMIIEERSGLQFFIEEYKVESLMKELEKNKFIKINGEYINSADIKGVFKIETINQRNLKKPGSGTWICNKHPEYPNHEIPYNKQCGYC